MRYFVLLAAISLTGIASANGSSSVCFVPPSRILIAQDHSNQIFTITPEQFETIQTTVEKGEQITFHGYGNFVPQTHQPRMDFGVIYGTVNGIKTQLWVTEDSSTQ